MTNVASRWCRARYPAVLAILVWLVGCPSSAPRVRTAEDLRQVSRRPDLSTVCGRIRWLEKGEEKRFGEGIFTRMLVPHLLRMECGTRTANRVEDNGEFCWSLTAGSYLVHKMGYRDPWSGNYILVPKVAFSVPEAGRTFYVGTLEVEQVAKRDLLGGLSGALRYRVLDGGDHEVAGLARRFEIPAHTIETSLMVHDPRFPGTFDTTEEYNRALALVNVILFGLS